MPNPQSAQTLPQLIRSAANAFGDDIAIRLADGEASTELGSSELSFADLERKSSSIAKGLLARGVGKGARVGFIFNNGPGFALMLCAIARIGAVAVPISTMIRAGELVRVLRQSDIGGLIVQRDVLGHDLPNRLCEALPDLTYGKPGALRLAEAPYLRWIISSGSGLPASFSGLDYLTDHADSISDDILLAVEAEVHTADQLLEIYTSGSMALPKGVRHNHGPVLFRTHYLRSMLGQHRGKQVQVPLPMFWVGGLMMFLLPGLEAGATSVCSARTLNNSQAAMGSVLAEDDLAKLAQSPKPWWGLGMSETLGPYSYGDEFRAPGYPVCAPMDHFADGYEVRIADENNQPVGDGEIGEMQLRGYPVAPALHKIERSDHFTPDGYLKTGDLCLVDGARIHFVGRGGDMIKTAGSNVSPAEVEMELQALEGVHSAFVVGLPDRERGQLLVAAVVPRDGATLDFAVIETEMRKRLSPYKVPRGWAEITREEVPLLHSNKVARREIAAMMANKLGRPAS